MEESVNKSLGGVRMVYKKNIQVRDKRRVVVDIFCHYISEPLGKRVGGSYPRSSEDPDTRLKIMDEYGIDIQAISLPSPYLLGLSVDDAAEICRSSNDDNYALCKAFPDQFVNICLVSLLDVKEALKEVGRGINELDCRGITVATNQNGKGLDSQEYFPFYEKLVEYDLPLFLHPTHWES